MIKFNGRKLPSWVSVTGISFQSTNVSVVEHEAKRRVGNFDAGVDRGGIEINIDIFIEPVDNLTILDQADELKRFMIGDNWKVSQLILTEQSNKYYNARVSNADEIVDNFTHGETSITFYASDPKKYDLEETVLESSGGELTVDYEGLEDTPVSISVPVMAETHNIKIVDETDNKEMEVLGKFSEGQELVFNSENRTVELDGVNVKSELTFKSNWVRLLRGPNKLKAYGRTDYVIPGGVEPGEPEPEEPVFDPELLGKNLLSELIVDEYYSVSVNQYSVDAEIELKPKQIATRLVKGETYTLSFQGEGTRDKTLEISIKFVKDGKTDVLPLTTLYYGNRSDLSGSFIVPVTNPDMVILSGRVPNDRSFSFRVPRNTLKLEVGDTKTPFSEPIMITGHPDAELWGKNLVGSNRMEATYISPGVDFEILPEDIYVPLRVGEEYTFRVELVAHSSTEDSIARLVVNYTDGTIKTYTSLPFRYESWEGQPIPHIFRQKFIPEKEIESLSIKLGYGANRCRIAENTLAIFIDFISLTSWSEPIFDGGKDHSTEEPLPDPEPEPEPEPEIDLPDLRPLNFNVKYRQAD